MIEPSNLIHLQRSDIEKVAHFGWWVVDHPELFTNQERDDADYLLDACTRLLVYGPEWSAHLVPVGFCWDGFFTALVEQFILDLPEVVKADHPGLVQMAKSGAKMVDTQGYGTEFRLDCLDALNRVLASLWEARDEVVNDPDYDPLDSLIRNS